MSSFPPVRLTNIYACKACGFERKIRNSSVSGTQRTLPTPPFTEIVTEKGPKPLVLEGFNLEFDSTTGSVKNVKEPQKVKTGEMLTICGAQTGYRGNVNRGPLRVTPRILNISLVQACFDPTSQMLIKCQEHQGDIPPKSA